eukprot:1196051-Amorphochlora_amoeboformis.AAC.1
MTCRESTDTNLTDILIKPVGIQSIDDPRAVERILKANNFEEESVVYNAPLEDFFRGSELNIDP